MAAKLISKVVSPHTKAAKPLQLDLSLRTLWFFKYFGKAFIFIYKHLFPSLNGKLIKVLKYDFSNNYFEMLSWKQA